MQDSVVGAEENKAAVQPSPVQAASEAAPAAVAAEPAKETPAEAPAAEAAPVATAPAEPKAEEAPAAEPEAAAPAAEASAEKPAEKPVVEAADAAAMKAAAHAQSLDELMEAARMLEALPAAEISREAVASLRQHFARLTKPAEAPAAEAAPAAEPAAEAPAAEAPAAEPVPAEESAEEKEFKAILNNIKEKKAAYAAEVEAQKQANLDRKNAIIAEILVLAGDTDNVNRTFPRYRELQDEFNALGEVPATEETAVWKRFQEAREQFSDNLKINKELRDYDFKKNLEQKELIITSAVALADEKDVITAFRRLQELHNKWREIGPVAKELRDEIWTRFKDASQEINRRYQTYFEERKAREAENEAGKTAICERVEALDFASLKSFNAWDKMTETIKQAQEDWKKFGYASRKMNNALFNRFRATCDTFFALKAAYFKSVKEELAANLAKKTALVEKAEALKDSTDWKKTTDELVALQKEWKTIGAVAKKYSDAIWARFQAACDYFFEQKKAATGSVRATEQANLQAKRDLIKELDKATDDMPRTEVQSLIADLQERWKSIGHVPFREKDKVYEAFRNRINEIRAKFDIAERGRRQARFEENVAAMDGDDSRLMRERERQLRLLETRRAELRTYENNLGFLTAKSKSGNSLVQEFERKIERLRADITALEDKIKLLDSKL